MKKEWREVQGTRRFGKEFNGIVLKMYI